MTFVESLKVQGTYDGKIYAIGATESSVALLQPGYADEAGITRHRISWRMPRPGPSLRHVAGKLTKRRCDGHQHHYG